MKKKTSGNLMVVIVVNLLIWLISACALALVVGRINLPTYWPLAKRGVATLGLVSAMEPNNHQTVRYTYTAGQHSFDGFGRAGNGNPDFKNLAVGDRVEVFYDAANPSVSVLGNPQILLKKEELSVGAVATIFPTLIVIALNVKGILPRYKRARQ